MFIPKKGSHPLADAAPSKLTHDKKLVNIAAPMSPNQWAPDRMRAKPTIELPIFARYAAYSPAHTEAVS
jgi:hypothetical protein